MAKLDEENIIEVLKNFSEKVNPDTEFDEDVAWDILRNKIDELEAAKAALEAVKPKTAKKEKAVIIHDPSGGTVLGKNAVAYVFSKDTEAPVDDGSYDEATGTVAEIKAWSTEEYQLEGLLQVAHELALDDNSNKYMGKGFNDMIKNCRKTLKACGVVLSPAMLEVHLVDGSTVPQWKKRA